MAEKQATQGGSRLSVARSAFGLVLGFVSILLTGLLVVAGFVGLSLWRESGDAELWDLVPIAFVAIITLSSWLATWAVFSDPNRD